MSESNTCLKDFVINLCRMLHIYCKVFKPCFLWVPSLFSRQSKLVFCFDVKLSRTDKLRNAKEKLSDEDI